MNDPALRLDLLLERGRRILSRRGGTLRHFWSSELLIMSAEPGQHARHVDFMWPLWGVLDHTPEGRGTDWMPQLVYPAAKETT